MWWQVAVKNLPSDWGGEVSCFPQHLNVKDPQDGHHGKGAFLVLKKQLNYNHMGKDSGATGCENSQLPQPAVSTIHSLHSDNTKISRNKCFYCFLQ